MLQKCSCNLEVCGCLGRMLIAIICMASRHIRLTALESMPHASIKRKRTFPMAIWYPIIYLRISICNDEILHINPSYGSSDHERGADFPHLAKKAPYRIILLTPKSFH